MPELPDVEVFSSNLNDIFAAKKLLKVKVINGRKLKDTQHDLSKRLEGKVLKKIYRSGKEMRFQFDDNTLFGLHLMLTGDIFISDKKNEHAATIVELYFEGGHCLALTDRMMNANIKLDPIDKAGVDAVSDELNFAYLKQALKRRTNIKNILMDQNVIRGIGNSYSDEILWEAKISPYSIANAIPDEKIRELVKVTKKILKDATKKIYSTYPGRVK